MEYSVGVFDKNLEVFLSMREVGLQDLIKDYIGNDSLF